MCGPTGELDEPLTGPFTGPLTGPLQGIRAEPLDAATGMAEEEEEEGGGEEIA